MASDTQENAQAFSRLHPVSFAFRAGRSIRSLILPGLLFLVLSRGSQTEVWLMILIIPSIAFDLIGYLAVRYRVGDEELIVREGVMTRTVRHIPFARIQNVDVIQNPLHRLFGVAEVRVETASGAEPEAVLRVLSLDVVERMRARVKRYRERSVSPAPRGVPSTVGEQTVDPRAGTGAVERITILQMRPLQLVGFGLITDRGMAVVLGALGLLTQVDLDEYYRPFFTSLSPYIPIASSFGAATVALTVLIVALVLKLLSVGWALVKLYGFTLSREGEDLRSTCGLLTRHSAVIPRARIQWLATLENPFQRLLRMVSIRVQTAGGGLKGGSSVNREWLAPLAPRGELPRLLREVQPELSLEGITWGRVHSRAATRLMRKGCSIVLGLTAATVFGAGRWGILIAVVGIPVVFLAARLRVRALGYAMRPHALLLRDGWWTRRMNIVRFSKIQSVSVSQSPFDRRLRMASLLIDTAGGRGRLAMPFLGVKTARSLALRLRQQAAAAEFKW